MRSFIRRSFYVEPPKAQSNPEEWNAWIKQDDMAAKQAKRAFTKSLKDYDISTMPSMSVRKINGRYQQVASLGFTENSSFAEPIEEAPQEVSLAKAQENLNKLTSRTHGKGHKTKRASIRAARKAKYRN